MEITKEEFTNNINHYLNNQSTEDIIITENNEPIIKLSYIKHSLNFLDGLLKDYSNEDDGMNNANIKWDRIKNN